MECGTIIVPETRTDKCGGCFGNPECIIMQEDIEKYNIKKGDSLQDFINSLILKIEELELK